jgi:hypothetical protein
MIALSSEKLLHVLLGGTTFSADPRYNHIGTRNWKKLVFFFFRTSQNDAMRLPYGSGNVIEDKKTQC